MGEFTSPCHIKWTVRPEFFPGLGAANRNNSRKGQKEGSVLKSTYHNLAEEPTLVPTLDGSQPCMTLALRESKLRSLEDQEKPLTLAVTRFKRKLAK